MKSFLEFLEESKKKKVKPSKADFLLNQLKKKKPKVNVEYTEPPKQDDNESNIEVSTPDVSAEPIAEDEGGGAIAGGEAAQQAGIQTGDVLGKFDGTINGIMDKKKKNFYIPKNVLGKKKILKRVNI